ncbi:hypothetical protein Leryth_015868 [Lithospermum erythrorhizon]|nr:hypothetical protein Leryth_015868 [Lithospermum erythrorhizon]
MEGLHENNGAKECSGCSFRSPLSTYTLGTDSMDLTDGWAIDTSIEQLYNNVHEMQCLCSTLPSSRSLMSYGGESRIDSELRFLAGGDHEEMEEKKEVGEENGDDRDGVLDEEKKCNDDKKGDGDEICTSKIEPVSLEQENGVLQPSLSSEPSTKPNRKSRSFHNRPPTLKQGASSKKLNTVSSLKNGTGSSSETAYIGDYLLKQAKQLLSSGDNPQKVLKVVVRAMNSFEKSANKKPNLEYVMCLHIIAALYCRFDKYMLWHLA